MGRTIWALAILAGCGVTAGSYSGAPLATVNVPELKKIEHDGSAGRVTLTWSGKPGARYAVEESTDPALGWEVSATEMLGATGQSTLTLLPQPRNVGAKSLLFRLREVPTEEVEKSSSTEQLAMKTRSGAENSGARSVSSNSESARLLAGKPGSNEKAEKLPINRIGTHRFDGA